LPRQVRLGLVRANSGFCQEPWLALLEQRRLPYIVAAQLSVKLQSLRRRGMGWTATGVPGLAVGELAYHRLNWRQPRRLILLRRRDDGRGGGKRLVTVPGYRFQALGTSLPTPALQVWRRHNGRANVENVIKELKRDFALGTLCGHSCWATEAALSLGGLADNLTQLFTRHLGWLQPVTATTLRHRLWHGAGSISRTHGRTTIRRGMPPPPRAWWQRLWEKLLAPDPNCNAVGQTTGETSLFMIASALLRLNSSMAVAVMEIIYRWRRRRQGFFVRVVCVRLSDFALAVKPLGDFL
jgi:hypothetical protein